MVIFSYVVYDSDGLAPPLPPQLHLALGSPSQSVLHLGDGFWMWILPLGHSIWPLCLKGFSIPYPQTSVSLLQGGLRSPSSNLGALLEQHGPFQQSIYYSCSFIFICMVISLISVSAIISKLLQRGHSLSPWFQDQHRSGHTVGT